MIISKGKGTFQLMVIMIFVSLLVAGISIYIVYHVVINEKKEYLKELSENQIGIIESISDEGKDITGVLKLLKRQQKINASIGKTGEFVVGYLKNDTIFYLLDHLRYDFSNPKPIAFNSVIGEPMRRALSQRTGIMTGFDYSNKEVLAYCSYIPKLRWGIVTKIDISEVNESFYKSGLYAGLIAIVLVTIATFFFRKISNPIAKKIMESEENLRAILDATQESIYLLDRQGKFIITNRIGTKRFNLSQADAIGHKLSEFMLPELALSRMEHLNNVFSSGKPEQFEDVRNGFHFEHHYYPCFKDDKVNYIATYSRDVTEIKKKELELLKLNRILKALGKSSQVMLKATDELSYLEEVCRIVVNDCGFAMVWIGYAQNDETKTVEPKACAGFEKGYLESLKISWADNERGHDPTGTSIREGQTVVCSNMIMNPAFEPCREDATKRGYASSLALPLSDNDKTFGAITIYSSEPDPFTVKEINFLTELAADLSYGILSIRSKIAKTKVEKELLESEEKLTLALENASIGVWVWDILTNEIEWDVRMERMFGIKPGSFAKTYDAFESFLVDEDIPHTRKALQKALEEEIHFETVYRIKLGNGGVKYINAKALVTKDGKGKPVKMTGVCFDITEMKKDAEQVLFKLNEELMRSNKELEQFAYIASHDLQEPLRMVSSFTQLLAKRYKDKLDEDAREFIQFAVDGASRMQTLINDLLAFSRIQTKGKEFTDVDMHEVLGQAVYNLSINIQAKNALLTNGELSLVYADEGQMIQVLQNLIGNALKFSMNAPLIHISSKEENDYFIFSVKDNGIGIEKQYFERIFQIFQRLLPKDEYEGTGIGLAICKRIIERHGGKIWVESEINKGTTFYFTIKKIQRS